MASDLAAGAEGPPPMRYLIRVRTFAIAFAVMGLACTGGKSSSSSPPKPRPDARLTVMTYNMNFGLAGDRETLDAIAAGGADIVFLEEIDNGWERALRD